MQRFLELCKEGEVKDSFLSFFYMYLYQINYPIQEQYLCSMEMQCLFNDNITMPNHCIISYKNFPASRSVYFKAKLEILCQSDSLEGLAMEVARLEESFQDFKLSYLKHLDYPLDYPTRMAYLKKLSRQIKGTGNIAMPKALLGIAYRQHIWYFGKLTADHQAWLKYQNKPQSYSQSLSTRLARSLVNIASGGDLSCTLVDPCCGAGTVLLEALDLGHLIHGYDIHQGMCWKSNRNLTHYGYKPLVICQDLNTLEHHYDVAILDIPYNLYSRITPQQQATLIKSCAKIAQRLILISYEDLREMLMAQGWQIDKSCQVTKMKFTRHIYQCHK